MEVAQPKADCRLGNTVEQILRFTLPYYLSFIFIGTVAGAIYGYQSHDGWMMGDWLINYQGGMLRRGLLGEIVYQLSNFTGISPGLFVLFLLVFISGIFFRYSYLLLVQQIRLTPYLLLIFSPFIFSFHMNDFQAALRKEILFFALFSYFIYIANTVDTTKLRIYFYALLLIFPGFILTHEMLAIFLPYFVIVYLAKIDLNKKEFFITSALLSLSGIAFLVSLYFSGNQNQVDAVKQSLIEKDFEVIGGAVDWLAFSTSLATGAVKEFIVTKYYLFYYGLAVLLASIAFVPVRHRLARLIKNKLIIVMFIVILIGNFALFSVAIDWGRFLYANLVGLFLLLLLLLPGELNPSSKIESTFSYGKPFTISVFILFLLYTQAWFIPHCCEAQPIHTEFSKANLVSFLNPYKKLFDF